MEDGENPPQNKQPQGDHSLDEFSNATSDPFRRVPLVMHAQSGNAFALEQEKRKRKEKEKAWLLQPQQQQQQITSQPESAKTAAGTSQVEKSSDVGCSSSNRFNEKVAIPRQLCKAGSGLEIQAKSKAQQRSDTDMVSRMESCGLDWHPTDERLKENDSKPPVPEKDKDYDYSNKNNNNNNDHDKKKDTKKSKVAMLASKFSLKDIRDEYRKAPSTERHEDANNPHRLGEERLYVPKPKLSGTCPFSAPPWRPSNDESCQSPHEAQVNTAQSSPGVLLYRKHGEREAEEWPGEASNANKGTARVVKMSVQEPSGYGSSECSQQHSSENRAPEGLESGPAKRYDIASIVSRIQRCELLLTRKVGDPLPLFHPNSTSPSAFNVQEYPYEEPVSATASQATADSGSYQNVTAQAGYAPPPPYLSYPNGLPFEKENQEQRPSHQDNIHIHLDTVIDRLTKTLQDGNSRSTSQITRQVEAMVNLCGLIHSRTVSQTEMSRQLQQHIGEIRGQFEFLRQETRTMEQRLVGNFNREIEKVRAELEKLTPLDIKARRAEGQVGTEETEDNKNERHGESQWKGNKQSPQKRKNRPQRQPGGQSNEEHETRTPPFERANRQSVSRTVPTPTAAFRTPDSEIEVRTDGEHRGYPRRTPLRPCEESSGSPTPRAVKLNNMLSHSDAAMLTDSSSSTSKELDIQKEKEIENKENKENDSEFAKTPRKKGVFGFRRKREGDNHQSKFLRTPRSDKESHIKNTEHNDDCHESSSSITPPVLPVRAPPAVATEAGQRGNELRSEDISPSHVHPALRNPQQQQQMRERERRLERHKLPSKTPSLNPNMIHQKTPFNHSISHHDPNFRTPATYNRQEVGGNPLYRQSPTQHDPSPKPNMHQPMMLFEIPAPHHHHNHPPPPAKAFMPRLPLPHTSTPPPPPLPGNYVPFSGPFSYSPSSYALSPRVGTGVSNPEPWTSSHQQTHSHPPPHPAATAAESAPRPEAEKVLPPFLSAGWGGSNWYYESQGYGS